MIKNKDLKRRIIEISYKKHLGHIGSCLTAVDIIDEIYAQKKADEKFVLSSGHAGLALYVVLEKYFPKRFEPDAGEYAGLNAESIFEHHGVHPDLCGRCHLDCSTGSLGHGLPIALGMALANRTKNVYCLISDGECMEGSIIEALRIKDEQLVNNLHVYVNANGYGAYREIPYLPFDPDDAGVIVKQTTVEQLPFLHDIDAHYHTMNEEEYKQAMEILQ